MIVSSAIKLKSGEVIKGFRHGDAFHNLYLKRFDLKEHIGCIQGFVTDAHIFLDRKQGAVHAWKCNQITRKRKILYSEHVWPHDLPEWNTRPMLCRIWKRENI